MIFLFSIPTRSSFSGLVAAPLPKPRFLAPFMLLLLAALMTGCVSSSATSDPYSKQYSSRELNAKPTLLNGSIIKNSNLSGLRIENAVIRNATLLNTQASGAYLKNVVFENCRLIHATFDRSVLENVTFKGGVITCEKDADNVERRSQFTNSRLHNLVLDGTYLENTVFDCTDSSITIRNAHHILATTPLITGNNIALTLHNSLFRNMTIADTTGTSTLAAADCTFYYATFGRSTFQKISFLKNVTYGPSVLPQKASVRRARTR